MDETDLFLRKQQTRLQMFHLKTAAFRIPSIQRQRKPRIPQLQRTNKRTPSQQAAPINIERQLIHLRQNALVVVCIKNRHIPRHKSAQCVRSKLLKRNLDPLRPELGKHPLPPVARQTAFGPVPRRPKHHPDEE
ncbi:MAG: hypothetical protein EBR81_01430 [Proteobacteria bacterium]|nr:hypothetical protein [Pseudomonadota bacterium]